MTGQLMPFDYEGNEIRTMQIDGAPAFIGKDACTVLGISKYRDAITQLDDDERVSVAVDTLGGTQQMTAVTESGLYALMLISRSPKVKPFRRWVTGTVLPQIRKTSFYGQPTMSRVELLSRAVLEATSAIAELEPKAKAFDAFLSSVGDYSVNEAAKVLSRDHGILTGQGRLFQFMETIGWIYRDAKNRPLPYQTQVDAGRLVAKPQFHFHPETGDVVADPPQIRITAKGLDALRGKYLDTKSA